MIQNGELKDFQVSLVSGMAKGPEVGRYVVEMEMQPSFSTRKAQGDEK